MIYGYTRISTKKQSIERQIRNIKKEYADAAIVEEKYTGTTTDRPEWNKLHKKVKAGDTIIFDSVSRMARNAEEGTKLYFELYEKGIELVFLEEHYIDTKIYSSNMKDKIELTGEDEDLIFIGINNYFKRLAEKQIRIAFEQAQKEVDDLHQRTREGIETARLNGKQIGQKRGATLNIKKKEPIKKEIRKKSKSFDGAMSDADLIKVLGIARNTYYKYKKEISEEIE